jgi:uncharacterized protein (TIGR02145 family)
MVCISGCTDKGTGPTAATYSVQVESEGDGATGAGKYEGGTEVTIFAGKAPTGKKFKNWTASVSSVVFADAKSDSTTFLMPAKDVKVTAVFEGSVPPTPPTTPNTYMLTVSGGGTGATKDGVYEVGQTVTISAGTFEGKVFKNWSGSGVIFEDKESATTTFVMPAKNVQVVAVFEGQGGQGATTYKLTVSSEGKGASGSGNYAAGEAVNIKAGTVEGKEFKNWSANGVFFADAKSENTEFVMPAKDVTVLAVFDDEQSGTVTTYKVTVTAGSDAKGGGDYATGDKVTIEAGNPPDGQQFKIWTSTSADVDFEKKDNAITTFYMPAHAVDIKAEFEPKTVDQPKQYNVKVNSEGTESSGTGTYTPGDKVIIMAGDVAGRPFKNWTTTSKNVVFDQPQGKITTFVMPENDVEVKAVFAQLYKVTVNGGAGASGGGEYAPGDIVTVFSGTAPNGQELLNWRSTLGLEANFADKKCATTTFIMPNGSVTVEAVFGVKTYESKKIGKHTWMTENLNITVMENRYSSCYDNADSNCVKYGRLYEFNAAQRVCPSGWHLPTVEEWDDLVTTAGGLESAFDKLISKSGWRNNVEAVAGKDEYGFSALPGGLRTQEGKFEGIRVQAHWWTASEIAQGASTSIIWASIYNPRVGKEAVSKQRGLSVRCVKSE